jgi:hypothetical protein
MNMDNYSGTSKMINTNRPVAPLLTSPRDINSGNHTTSQIEGETQETTCTPTLSYNTPLHREIVRDSSAVWRLLWICCSRETSEGYAYGKQLICLSNSWSAHFHVSWLSDFIFYQKPLYKSLHQSFFYSFITILPSESGVTLHYSTILP